MLQGLKGEGKEADDWHGAEKNPPRIHWSLHKGLVGGGTHIEAIGPMGDDANSTKCILDTLKGHCKQRSNKIVAATAYK